LILAKIFVFLAFLCGILWLIINYAGGNIPLIGGMLVAVPLFFLGWGFVILIIMAIIFAIFKL